MGHLSFGGPVWRNGRPWGWGWGGGVRGDSLLFSLVHLSPPPPLICAKAGCCQENKAKMSAAARKFLFPLSFILTYAWRRRKKRRRPLYTFPKPVSFLAANSVWISFFSMNVAKKNSLLRHLKPHLLHLSRLPSKKKVWSRTNTIFLRENDVWRNGFFFFLSSASSFFHTDEIYHIAFRSSELPKLQGSAERERERDTERGNLFSFFSFSLLPCVSFVWWCHASSHSRGEKKEEKCRRRIEGWQRRQTEIFFTFFPTSQKDRKTRSFFFVKLWNIYLLTWRKSIAASLLHLRRFFFF